MFYREPTADTASVATAPHETAPGDAFRMHPATAGVVSERLLGPVRAHARDLDARSLVEVLWTPDASGLRCGARRGFDLVVGALVGDAAPLRAAIDARLARTTRTSADVADDAFAAHAARVAALDEAALLGACRRLYAPLRRAARPRPFLEYLRA